MFLAVAVFAQITFEPQLEMNAIAPLNVSVIGEVKKILRAVMFFAIVTLVMLALGFIKLAAIPACMGLLAAWERLHRLLRYFRSRNEYWACLFIVFVWLVIFAAAGFVIYVGGLSSLHARGGA